jgi:hypothetical protein
VVTASVTLGRSLLIKLPSWPSFRMVLARPSGLASLGGGGMPAGRALLARTALPRQEPSAPQVVGCQAGDPTGPCPDNQGRDARHPPLSSGAGPRQSAREALPWPRRT